MYNFESEDRYNTDCIKFDFTRERNHREDCLSYWVADMDFKTAPEIVEDLHRRVEHGIFGYTNIKPHYFEAVRNWLREQHGYGVERAELVETPGVVFAIVTAIRAFTGEGESVLTLTPVYYPFTNSIRNTRRKLVSSALIWKRNTETGDGKYEIDFVDFENKIADNNVKLFLLCNPHNPGGRSWTREELSMMADICSRHNVIVFSDEIHADFVWKPNIHTVFATVSPEAEQISVTATSPSKTFNLAGLQVSNIFIKNRDLFKKYKTERNNTGYDEPSALGLTACESAYTRGLEWHKACRGHIESNLEFAVEYINRNSGGLLHAAKPEATYLLWVDCSALPFDDAEQNRRITEDGNLWLDPGNVFGTDGENFQRINVATGREYLEKGLAAFVRALTD